MCPYSKFVAAGSKEEQMRKQTHQPNQHTYYILHDGALVAFAHRFLCEWDFLGALAWLVCTYRNPPNRTSVYGISIILFPCEVSFRRFRYLAAFESNRHSEIAHQRLSFIWRQFVSILLSVLFSFYSPFEKKWLEVKKTYKKYHIHCWFWLMEISWLHSFQTRRRTKWKETFENTHENV